MKERIKDLWRGNIDPQSDGILTTPETTQIMGFIHRHRDALYKTLTDEQQEIFEKLDDCWAEYNHLMHRSELCRLTAGNTILQSLRLIYTKPRLGQYR